MIKSVQIAYEMQKNFLKKVRYSIIIRYVVTIIDLFVLKIGHGGLISGKPENVRES